MKPFTLQPILELMQTRADEATRRLARLIAAEQDARSKLQMLQQYRDEYAARFRDAARNGLAQREWRNYQAFLDRLDEAIGQQGKAVNQQIQHTLAGQNEWQAHRTRLKAFDTLSERHRASELAEENRREQKLQDEFATRRDDTVDKKFDTR
jgi:flagellar FliJ protein